MSEEVGTTFLIDAAALQGPGGGILAPLASVE